MRDDQGDGLIDGVREGGQVLLIVVGHPGDLGRR
jgi:hypothetical protein